MKNKISIIVPVYNVEKYILRCLESIISQTYKNIEIIVVNDGSTDKSLEYINFFSRRDKRIIILDKKNGGLSDARNRGMKIATGDYYMFIDSDDYIAVNFCEKLLNVLLDKKADMSSCRILDFNLEEEILKFSFKEQRILKKLERKEALVKYFRQEKSVYIYHGVCMKLYKKELFNELIFPVGKLHEDLYITYKLLDRSNSVAYINEPLYYYYQRTDSISRAKKIKNIKDELGAINEYIDYFESDKEIMPDLLIFLLNNYARLYIELNTIISNEKEKMEIEKEIKEKIKKISINKIIYKNDIHLKLKIKYILIKISLYGYKKVVTLIKEKKNENCNFSSRR